MVQDLGFRASESRVGFTVRGLSHCPGRIHCGDIEHVSPLEPTPHVQPEVMMIIIILMATGGKVGRVFSQTL